MSSLHITLFGAPVVRLRSADSASSICTSDFRTRKMVVLLALLARQPGTFLPREVLAEALWPERDPTWQRNRLRYELLLLRQVLGEDAIVRKGNLFLALADTVTSDVHEFERVIAAADKATGAEQTGLWERAALLQSSDLLPGYYDEAIQTMRESLREALHRVLCGLIEEAERAGQQAQASSWRRTFVARFPADNAPLAKPASTVATQRNNATTTETRPTPSPTTFFGRATEIQQIRAWAETGSAPLLTLTGPGGMGKTRLAGVALPDSVFVPLADVPHSSGLYAAIRTALGRERSHENQHTDDRTAVWKRLQAAPTTLILDNFEQLVENGGAQQVAELIRAIPQTRCLITSRTRLEIAGEQEVALSPLPSPEAGAMFLERARAVRGDFPNDENVAAICKLLDGIPLALELAAARALTLGPAQIRTQLDDRFSFLTSRRRDVPERQRSLRATLEWSLQLLPPALREMFFRLSLFRGGFTQEAAEAVCGGKSFVVDGLETLRAHSLVQVSFTKEGAARYDLLVTMRDFGQAHLSAPLRNDVERRQAIFYAKQVHRWEFVPVAERFDQVERERENLILALETWAKLDGEACARMAVPLCEYWELAGHQPLSRHWLQRCLAFDLPDVDLRAALWVRWGSLTINLSERTEAYTKALAAFQESGDPLGIGQMYHALGSTAHAQGKFSDALRHYEGALPFRNAADDKSGLASTLHMMAVTKQRLAPTQEAEVTPLLEEAEKQLRELNDTLGLAFVLSTRREFAYHQGDLLSARRLAQEVESLFTQHRRLTLAAHLRAWQVLPALADDDLAAADAFITQASEMLARQDDSSGHVFLWRLRGRVRLHQAAFADAFADFRFALLRYQEMQQSLMMLICLRDLANWHLRARQDARRALALWSAIDALQPNPPLPLPSPERRFQEQYYQEALALLTPPLHDAAEDASSLTLEEAVALALNF